jgi:release factor glutamine methyltransferase
MPNNTAAALLAAARRELELAGINSSALDARLLLQYATGLDHATLIADPNQAITLAQSDTFRNLMALRLQHQPVSKIVGYREFYGRRFSVSRDVLDPRPDTETLIDLCLSQYPTTAAFNFIDLGSGSGAIGITIACERALAKGICIDHSEAALSVTRANAKALGVSARLDMKKSDWFSGVTGTFDLVVSNPPYITTADIAGLSPDVRIHDPLMALDGGTDGLGCYRAIAAGAGPRLARNARIIVEIGAGQAPDVSAIFARHGLVLRQEKPDLAGHTRALLFSAG